MSPPHSVPQAIRRLLAESGSFRSGELAARTARTRQAVHRHLVRALDEGWLVREGAGRGARYRAADALGFARSYGTEDGVEELASADLTRWLDAAAPGRSDASRAILAYVVSELVNNAVDHSGAAAVRLEGRLRGGALRLAVVDEGIGAFERVRSHFGFDDHLRALQELSKGKTTTQPDRHTGEGLFFGSKLVDAFRLAANGLAWLVDNRIADQAVESAEPAPGTRAELELELDTRTRIQDVFERYTHDFEFDTTRCVVRLFDVAETFVSRSEAKRLVSGLERFAVVVLDFHGVTAVGQGFVDQVFRVWAREHPGVRLVPVEMGEAVEFMVRRGLARAAEERRRGAE